MSVSTCLLTNYQMFWLGPLNIVASVATKIASRAETIQTSKPLMPC